MIKKIALIVLYFCLASRAYAAGINVEDLVDEFMLLTEVQQGMLEERYIGETIRASGAVIDVEEPALTDKVTAIKGKYYKVMTKAADTPNNNRYKVIFCYEDIEKAKRLNKGDLIENDGSLLDIINWKLYVAVWVYVSY
jgi:5-methylcytosine-specific restriction endonuclease McrBC GTP-binding regulatory subunit McrB